MFEQTQSVDVLIDKYISENNVQTQYDKEKPAFLDSVIDDYLKKSGYEIPGEIPKERPVPYPEGTYPGVTPPPKGTYIETVRRPEERAEMEKIGMTAGTEDWMPKLPLWQQIKDLAVAWGTGKIDPGEHLWDDAIRGLSLGNIQDPLGLIEKISGKPGLKERIEARQAREIEAVTGKKAVQYKEAVGLGEKAASALGSMITFTPVLQGASIPARAISSIPAVQAAVRAAIMGTFTAIASKPEDDSAWNRLKRWPKEVLIWGGLEAGFMTASEIAKIINYNMRVPKGMRGRWGRWETVPPIEPEIPGKVMVKEFTPEEIFEIKRTMDTNAAGTTKTKFTPHQQQAIDYFSKTNGPGWRAYKQGFKTPPIEVPGKPAVYPTATYGEVARMPRQPKFTDVFRKGPLPQFEETFNAKWPEPGEVPKMAPEAPGAPPPVAGMGMAPKAAPARPEPQPGPIAGEIPSPETPPQVVLDISPKRGGGWTYTFKPGVVEAVPAAALKAISPDIINQLPSHFQEIIKTRLPKTWRPKAAKTFNDLILDRIYKLGGIKPDKTFSTEILKDLELPVGIIRTDGLSMDLLAQSLVHDFPEIDTPYKSPDDALYDLLFQRVIRTRHGIPAAGRGEEQPPTAEETRESIEDWYAKGWVEGTLDRETLDPSETKLIQELKDKKRISDEDYGKYPRAKREGPAGETLGEFEGPGYQGADREAIKEDYRKYLESKGTAPEVIKKQLALFGGEFAPAEEPVAIPKPKVAPEPVLIEIPKRDKSIFDSRGLGSFKDINVWRKQVQPFIEQGYVVEYSHVGGTKGWAELIEKKKPGEGKLISYAKPVEGLKKAPGQMNLDEFKAELTWGAEPAATMPGEPIEFIGEDWDKSPAALFTTDKEKYYIKRDDGTLVYNPKTRKALFDNGDDAWKEYHRQEVLATGRKEKPKVALTEMEGILEYEKRFTKERRIAPPLSKEELAKITDYERRFGERRAAVSPGLPEEVLRHAKESGVDPKSIKIISPEERKEYVDRYGLPNAIDEGQGRLGTRGGDLFIDDDTGKPVAYLPAKTVAEAAKPLLPKEPTFDLRRQLAAIMPKLNVPREKWGEVSRRALENYKPEEGKLEDYVRKIAFGRAPTGVPILTDEGEPWPHKEEPKEISIERIPEPSEKEKGYDRFEMKEQEARIRDVVMKEAHDDIDLDILESRIFKDPPESLEVIGTRHGISRQAVDKRWQALIEKLKQNPYLLEILNKKYELHSFPGIIGKKNIEDLRDLINKYFSSSKGVSKEVDMVNDERVGGILAERFGATVEAKKLDKYIKEQGSSPAIIQYFKDLLEGGNIQGAALPADVKQNLLSMRERIDRLSDMIIANGGVPEKTKAVFEDNIGKYLGKFYRIYEMMSRAKGKIVKRYWDPPQPVRDRFKNALKQQFPQTFGTYSDEELDNFLEGMVRKTDLYARGAKRTKRIPPEHYIHRIKLTPEYREFAGEIMDPRYLYLKTVSEQAVMGYNAKMLKLVKDTYPDLWTKDLDKARRLGWQKSQLPEDWHAYGEMAGLYIDPELGEYLRNEFFPSRSGMEHMIEKWIINPFKWTKTIGSIPTHARNFLGNPMFSMLMRNSIWNPGNAWSYIKAAQIIVGREGKYAKVWEDLVKHGVTETQFWGAEIPRFYEELLRIDPADWPEKLFDAGVKRPINTLSNLYNSEDAIYRIASHLKNVEYFHMTPMQSVEELNLGMTNYRKLPTAVEILRRYPVFGPFISFKANVAKILYNQAKQAAKDMGSKSTRSKGIRRGFILASALALPIILQEVTKKVFHIDSEDQKIIEKYMPEWRRHGIYFYWRNNKGTAKVFDFTYIYPAGDIQKSARAALAGDISSFKDAINLFAHPVLDLYSILMQDRDPTWGTKLPGGFKEQIARAITQVWLPASAPIPSLKALVHGEIRAGSLTPYQVKTLIDSWYGEAPIGREPKKFTEELKNFLTGVRTFDLNPEQIMKTYLRSKRFELTESINEYRTWLKQNPGAKDYEVNDKLKALQAKQKKISEALKQASEDIIKLRKGGFALESEK